MPKIAAPTDAVVKVVKTTICGTDLHILKGDVPTVTPGRILGHEGVGVIQEVGAAVATFHPGDRVIVSCISSCGKCEYCRKGHENLCDRARFTGYQIDGGYAEYTVADARFCFPLPPGLDDVAAAPLLCAGLIGYRSLMKTGDARSVGIYGFGAAAHLLAQIARSEGRQVFAFTRPGDIESQAFARSLGVTWAGGSDVLPPEQLDAAIIFAAAGELVPVALRATRKGGHVVCAGIHMSDIPSFPYDLLWGERSIASVANLTRADGAQFMEIAARVDLHPSVEVFGLPDANEALERLRRGALHGAAVLVPPQLSTGKHR